jgi:prolyl-tRNA editing enzyme YbaK/EbsC (Cys-tRNA(Pro) deacylase)
MSTQLNAPRAEARIPARVQLALMRSGLRVQVCTLPHGAVTVPDVADALGVGASHVLKSIVARAIRTDITVVVLAAGIDPVDFDALGRRLNDSLKLARPKHVKAMLGYAPGTVPPIGLPAGVRVVIHESVPETGLVFTGAGAPGVVLAQDAEELRRALQRHTGSINTHEHQEGTQ